MAAKRAPAKSSRKSPPTRGARRPAPARKVAPPKETVAVKLLGQLPAIDTRLRHAYLAAFTEAQCVALGEKTVARQVLAEAVAVLPTLRKAVERNLAGGYSARRLAFLASLVVALEDELAAAGGHGGARASTLTWARGLSEDLRARLAFLAGGRAELLAEVQRLGASDGSVHQVRDALTGLIELGTRWRRDALMEVLADDADLTTARLSAAYNALEALARTDEVLREVVADGADSSGVNAIEGRILAELHVAQGALRFPSGPSLKKAFP